MDTAKDILQLRAIGFDKRGKHHSFLGVIGFGPPFSGDLSTYLANLSWLIARYFSLQRIVVVKEGRRRREARVRLLTPLHSPNSHRHGCWSISRRETHCDQVHLSLSHLNRSDNYHSAQISDLRIEFPGRCLAGLLGVVEREPSNLVNHTLATWNTTKGYRRGASAKCP
ncbi:uncharacterized protein BDR25DRAFT_50937 [Lindgomyces ingoldianus]|uniref:Uncharacterized protein n=1 Tax=Lindgomyces ingoldianus TaxID=673940 RepID=A0ACB6QSB8_9PLEO|nr:uncharacterized protein BDR25DRAFT_50937 [Lindgomyces ingoldianus]KAF2469071.1 hypothetical protein BDR25DRAFT_50937 [Lindgomyces ingoldianus]